jgi:heme exporter protein B
MMALFRRDVLLAFRSGGGALTGVIFFLCVIAVIPFGVGPDLKLLARIGPAVIWIGALLATLLGLDRLFQADREDGSLDALILRGDHLSLNVTCLTKCAAHWVSTCLPLVLAAPLFGLLMNMEPLAIAAVTLTLLVGTPALACIGAVGAALAVSLPRGGLLISVLILPLTIPVLIFGVSATQGVIEDPAPFTAPFLVLCALTLLFAVIGPVAAALALKSMSD